MVNKNIWNTFTIEDLTKIFTKQTGFDYSAYIKPTLVQEYRTGYIPFIQNKDFEGKFINYDTDYYIPESVAKNFPRILLNENCLLISISGSIGNVAVFNNSQTAFIGGAVAVGKFKDKELLYWCMYYLLSNEGQNKLLANVKAGSHQNLILDDLRKIEIPIPPKEEQKVIAKALSDTDELIISLEKLISKKEAIKQGTMQQLLTGKKQLSGFSGEWEEKRLEELVIFINGKAHESNISEFGKYVVINSKFVSSNGYVKKYSNEILQSVQKNDIAMVMSDVPNGKAIAKCFYIEQNNVYTLNQRICILRAVKIDSKFLFYIINRHKYYLSFDDGAKQTNLRRQDILNCFLNIPTDIKEQQSIAQILSDMDNEIETLKSKLSKTKAIKDGIMSELLTGKTRLKVKDE